MESTSFPNSSGELGEDIVENISVLVGSGEKRGTRGSLPDDAALMIGLYSTIFVLCIVGNSLVIVTLSRNKRMRSVTNVFLLNLAVSDLLLGVFCMPFTLIGSLLREFVFGELMCRLINYFQGVSVSVGVWTLVSISLERYFAICRPLHSRQWQTVSHAYRIIALVWLGSLATMMPSILLSRLIPTRRPGKFKCREVWPDVGSERAFFLYLDAALLVVPLLVMLFAYSLIARKLVSCSSARGRTRGCGGKNSEFLLISSSSSRSKKRKKNGNSSVSQQQQQARHEKQKSAERQPLSAHFGGTSSNNSSSLSVDVRPTTSVFQSRTTTRGGTYDKNQAAKTRVVRMLFAVVVEFFVCWTPLYAVNTWSLFDARSAYAVLGYAGISAVYLLAYVSSCCNPLTYCFMHKKYRQAFLAAIGCKRRGGDDDDKRWQHQSHQSERSVTVSVFSTRTGSVRSEAVDRNVESAC